MSFKFYKGEFEAFWLLLAKNNLVAAQVPGPQLVYV